MNNKQAIKEAREHAEIQLLEHLISWAEIRKYEETNDRPDVNIYKRVLLQTWNQVIIKLSEELAGTMDERGTPCGTKVEGEGRKHGEDKGITGFNMND